MSLEAIEEHTLNYLAEVSNPLVRIEVLLAHLRDRGIAESLSVPQFKDFLARHERVRIMEPSLAAAEMERVAPAESGPGGTYVILRTRVPTPEQLTAMMTEQLQALAQALVTARLAAIENGDSARVGPIEEALRRIAALHKRLNPSASTHQN